MSTQNSDTGVAIDHPFKPDGTLTGERKGKTFRAGNPYPLIRVRVDNTILVVDQDDIR